MLKIPRRTATCHSNGELFKPGMEFISHLYEIEKGEVVRKDFCLACAATEKGVPRGLWKGKVPHPKEKKLPLERNARALELLRRALEDGQVAPEAFVLALYLARARLIAARQEFEGKILYEVLATEEMLAVPRVPLSQLEIAKIQTRLAQQFSPEADGSFSSPAE